MYTRKHTTHIAIFSDSDQKDNGDGYLSKIYRQDAPRVGFAANNAVKAEREAMGLGSRLLSLPISNTALDAYSKIKILTGRHSNWKHKMESYTLYSTLDSFLQKRSFKHWGKINKHSYPRKQQ